MKTLLWIASGLCMCGSVICFWFFFRLDKSEDRIRYIWTAMWVLPRAIWSGIPGFLLVWDTEIKLAMMKPGKELGKDF